MTRIILDDATCRRFLAVQDTAEICDSSGRVLGEFCVGTSNLSGTAPSDDCLKSTEQSEKRRAAWRAAIVAAEKKGDALLCDGKLPPGMESPFTDEERREARKYQGPGRTLDEIYKSLGLK